MTRLSLLLAVAVLGGCVSVGTCLRVQADACQACSAASDNYWRGVIDHAKKQGACP